MLIEDNLTEQEWLIGQTNQMGHSQSTGDECDYLWDRGFELFLHNEEDEGKTEDPTEGKKRKARDDGQVFLTQELPQSVGFVMGISVVFVFSGYYFNESIRYMQTYLQNDQMILLDSSSLPHILKSNVLVFVKFIMPIGAVVIVVSILLTMVQTKFLISFKNLKFNLQKIAPTWKNFTSKTIFTRNQLVNALKIIFKVLVTGMITFYFLTGLVPELWQLSQLDVYKAFSKMNVWLYQIALLFGGFLLLFAFPDYFIQRAEFIRKNKMTKDEVKREYKELEGDPQIKQKQRDRARQIATVNVVERVKEADVLITNPTHFACAVKYHGEMSSLKVVAKGIDSFALRMRKIAKENDVPIFENKPLARSIYANVEVDDEIPQEFYFALSEIYKTLDKFKTKAGVEA